MTTPDERPDGTPDDLERLLRLAGTREVPGARARHRARVAVRAAWEETLHARQRRRWLLIGVPALAGAAVLILGMGSWWQTSPRSAAPIILARVATTSDALQVRRGSFTRTLAVGGAIEQGDVVDTPAEIVAAFALEGGGEIRQNGSTSLRWTAARQVALAQGQIYVDSGRSGTSLTIATSAGLVRDIGTRFDVRVQAGDVRVRVRDGAVRIEAPAAARDAGAGRELVASVAGVVERPAAMFGDDWDWILRATSFHLGGATLASFVAWIGAESGRQVEFRPASLRTEMAATVLDGSVAGLSLTEALDTVLPAAGLTYQMVDDRIVIRRPGAGSRP